ncbi:uncharacterized protein RMCC_3123 [Mycolicibacterium canariasense]|uniref:Uncharacterized protein n=1 Tax=Mycolicibacterium canariasense TaxID=228230 RepID=A0A100WCT2_MYCCR|nr:hypothetical protein [Mycolicibacterium canariasense]MCV7207776.1 hypothetical protein [Mycolicibacterium canariasense]ORV04837.1 hypothetical protein AWB94_21060 [Mycolicibacterium canariasense]GAS96157.1 uncharacterized protein RMCC_3123 [Mycolicibacterium canariasense]
MTTPTEVRIAGVPWPTYKVIALIVGALALIVVGVLTASAPTAVLSAAAISTVTWAVFGAATRR